MCSSDLRGDAAHRHEDATAGWYLNYKPKRERGTAATHSYDNIADLADWVTVRVKNVSSGKPRYVDT